MLKNLAFLAFWFVITPPLLVSLIYFAAKQNKPVNALEHYPSIAANDFEIENNIDGEVLGTEIHDMRPYIVTKFLENTPLEEHSELIVEASDKYGIDYRLIPAIAMKESGGGSSVDPASHNAWGWNNGRTYFSSWESAIETVAKTLKEKYIAQGLETPDQIMPVYAPPQIYTGGKWAKDINYFFSEMESL